MLSILVQNCVRVNAEINFIIAAEQLDAYGKNCYYLNERFFKNR